MLNDLLASYQYINDPTQWQPMVPPADQNMAALAALQQLGGGGGQRTTSGGGKLGLNRLGGSDIEVLHGPGVEGHAGHLHLAAQKGIVPFGRKLQKKGFDVGEHGKFGGVDPVHTTGSHHYNDDAIDVNYSGGGRWATEADALAWLKRKLQNHFGNQAYYG